MGRYVTLFTVRSAVALISSLRAAMLDAASLEPCPGDCDGSGSVTVDELVFGVRIALGLEAVGDCEAADTNRDSRVTIEEILQAVNAVLQGCDPTPSPYPSVSVSPTPQDKASPTAESTPTSRISTPTPTSSAVAGPSVCFRDVALEAGLEYVHYAVPSPPPRYEQFFFAGGAAPGDFDGDGFVDLAVTRISEPALLLFRNRGDGTFAEISDAAGLRVPGARLNGVAWGDIDNDGDLDLYATAVGADQLRHYLFVNHGSGHFTEEAVARGAAVGTEEPHYGFSVAFGDYDRDGFLDLHVTEWRPRAYNRRGAPSHARLLRNEGLLRPGYFQDVTAEAGVRLDTIPPLRADLGFGFSFTSRFVDFDEDGWPDLAVAADFGTSRLFWNRGDGTFTDGTEAAGVGTDENGMGSAVGDVDGDGLLDWFVSSIWDPLGRCQGPEGCFWGTTGNRLFRNLGARKFEDVTDAYGVRDAGWGWGATFWDPDHDGDLDLVVANGAHLPILDLIGLPDLDDDYERDPLRVWENVGGTMREVARVWGLEDERQGRAVVVWDYDGDGDQDLFVANNADRPALYRNDCGARRPWFKVRVTGTRSNRAGIGARVKVWRPGDTQPQVREIDGGSNYLGHNELIAHFGLGAVDRVQRVEVVWPATGARLVWHNLPANTVFHAIEPGVTTRPASFHRESSRSRWR